MDPLTEWVLVRGPEHPDVKSLVAGLAEQLCADGIPLDRLWYGSVKLHPQVYASSFTWRNGEPMVETRSLTHERRALATNEKSPVSRLSPERPTWRVRLDGTEPVEVTILAELRAEGTTDYLVISLGYAGKLHAITSFTTRSPDGFSDAHVERICALRPALAAVTRYFEQYDLAGTLLATYLGGDAAQRVLQGQVRRGDGQTVAAALWFSDVRDFTSFSDRMPREAVLALINDAFEVQVAAIEAQGGTVLKFMGDGMLAIFEDEPEPACKAAMQAARDCIRKLAEANAQRASRNEAAIRIGLALHFGDVTYGNIGSTGRLDFTVIGPAVNRAARLESLCARLGRTVVASAEMARYCGESMEPLGRHTVKGVSDSIEVYGPSIG